MCPSLSPYGRVVVVTTEAVALTDRKHKLALCAVNHVNDRTSRH
jgi:hypothetical protein